MAQVILRPNTYKVGLCDPGVRYVLFKPGPLKKLFADNYGSYIINRSGKLMFAGTTPVEIFTWRTFKNIGGDGTHFAIDLDDKGWAWGDPGWGRYGAIDMIPPFPYYQQSTPVAIHGGHKWKDISYCFGIDLDGQAWAWGDIGNGYLGNNTNISTMTTPVAVCGNHTFNKIGRWASALDMNGQAWKWGSGNLTPVAIYGNHTFCYISGGGDGTAYIDNHGQAWTWGSNSFGNLGNNGLADKSTPVEVCGNHTFCRISNYYSYFDLAIDNHGQAWAWGLNNYGQLGNNTTGNTSTPVAVCGNHTFCEISVGGYDNFSLALDNHNKLWGWGKGVFYGAGDASNHSTPVAVYSNYT